MRRCVALLVLAAAVPSFAQKAEIFGDGKPVRFKEETLDKRFLKSKVNKLLKGGTTEPGCVQLLGGLFFALGELGTSLHKRDENFTLPKEIQDAVQAQLSTPTFPALAYLVSMVRRVMLDGHMSDEWLATAQAINRDAKIIDLGKLKMLTENLVLADSAYFTLQLLRQRYEVEALGANSAVTNDVLATFTDGYLDRDVIWTGAVLVDIGINQPKKKGGKKRYRGAEAEELVAILQWVPPDPRMNQVNLMAQAPVKLAPVTIFVRLEPKQYVDIERLHKGQRLQLKGKFWNMNNAATEFEVRQGLVFEDRDFSGGVLLGRPEDVATCSAAINELTGVAPAQPGGFRH